MLNKNVTFEVITPNNNPVTEYFHKEKTYIEGRKGNNYSIRVRNHTGKKILAVVTVDGLSVLDGERGSYNSSGYIVRPYNHLDIKGWRINEDEVREFYFSSKNGSYSSQVGEGTTNLGVIGIACFYEQEKPFTHCEFIYNIPPYTTNWKYTQPWTPEKRPFLHTYYSDVNYTPLYRETLRTYGGGKGSSSVFASMDSPFPEEELVGTGMGEKIENHSHTVTFDREKNPFVVMSIYYKTKRELDKMGVTRYKRQEYSSPEAFPNRYCKEV